MAERPFTSSINTCYPEVFGKGLALGQVRDPAFFKIDGRGLEGKPRVKVLGGCISDQDVREEKNEPGIYLVKYISHKVGYVDIHVFWNSTEVPDSPFQASICDFTAVKPIGGWEGVLNQDTGRI